MHSHTWLGPENRYFWKYQRVVNMLSAVILRTCLQLQWGNMMVHLLTKYTSVLDYNENVGNIDKIDMLLSSAESVHITLEWYKEQFFHLVDLAVVNAHGMYKVKLSKHIPLESFQLKLIRELISKYQELESPSAEDLPLPLTAGNFPQLVPAVP